MIKKKPQDVIIDTVQLKRGTSTSLSEQNPILLDGEPCIETNTGRVKFGCDLKHWDDLPYSNINIYGAANHERLKNLNGGDSSGHYHFTREQYQKLLALIDDVNPQSSDSKVITYKFTVQAESIAGTVQKEFSITAVS